MTKQFKFHPRIWFELIMSVAELGRHLLDYVALTFALPFVTIFLTRGVANFNDGDLGVIMNNSAEFVYYLFLIVGGIYSLREVYRGIVGQFWSKDGSYIPSGRRTMAWVHGNILIVVMRNIHGTPDAAFAPIMATALILTFVWLLRYQLCDLLEMVLVFTLERKDTNDPRIDIVEQANVDVTGRTIIMTHTYPMGRAELALHPDSPIARKIEEIKSSSEFILPTKKEDLAPTMENAAPSPSISETHPAPPASSTGKHPSAEFLKGRVKHPSTKRDPNVRGKSKGKRPNIKQDIRRTQLRRGRR